MMKRLSEPALALGLAVALALSAVTPSVGQTTRRHAPAAQEQGLSPAAPDETFGQRAPQAPSGGGAPFEGQGQAGQGQAGQCWIATEDNDRGNFGYYGPCSNRGARQMK
jgi:hypothetical protein